jgi:RNA:NAD 2'-phosphotransferase (TPT1/KptA family)
MSLEEAVHVMLKSKQQVYVLKTIIPAEYFDNREFLESILYSRPAALEHASTRLKNDKELVSLAIQTNGWTAIHALTNGIDKNDNETLKRYKKDPNVYIETEHNTSGEIVGYRACSNLLKNF